MGTIKVMVRCVAAWVDRLTYWEVLFPTAAKAEEQHLPKVTITTPVLRQSFVLKNQILDLSTIAADDAVSDPDWMLAFDTPDTAAVWKADVCAHSGVFASLRLPKFELRPLDSPAGVREKVEFNKQLVLVDSGTQLWGEVGGPRATVAVREAATGSITMLYQSDLGAFQSIEIEVDNRTEAEHRGTLVKLEVGKDVTDAEQLFNLVECNKELPTYLGTDTSGAKSPGAAAQPAKGGWKPNVAGRPCPQGIVRRPKA